SPASDDRPGYSVYRSAWRLFRLAQHLGLSANEIRQLDESQIEQIFACLDMDEESMSYLWLQAYEQHYRDQVFNAVVQNHGRGRWRERKERPAAQVIFCMDDREEGIRRHLEEINPMIETMGAAGFFSIAMNWQGLDDTTLTPLCPIVLTPAHNVIEQAIDGLQTRKQQHDQRRKQRLGLKNILHQELRRNLFSSVLLVSLSAPLALVTLLGKLFAPLSTGRFIRRLQTAYDLHVETDIKVTAKNDSPASADAPRDGFTDQEQADRIAGFLRTVGLSTDQGRFVVLMGHGSGSQNNPHASAYDCGACSGRHGGPNARAFARMANRPEVRALLQQQGLNIPTDSWFIGAEHNTCDEQIIWYDTRLIPNDLQAEFKQLKNDLSKACHASAHERCRRFASAPRNPTDKQALQHVVARAFDFSQARPELGHATNAVAFIGRRAISQGAFFDRRSFMISYNPKEDPAGKIIEAILLAAGPVAAGISLEYYFSTVNNAQYGCGSKITHNITGLFGVMDGTSGDLRTGLPQQMIEVHEAMRLQVLVEAKTEVLTRIYQEQPAIEELIGNGWLLLSAKDPDSERIDVFVPGEGFKPWQANNTEISVVTKSIDWYRGKHHPLSPVLIEQGGAHG
ncbi:MAG: DUF2309 domain-containing protein, partial [Gammaproteobacteria bacterium]|nr:DUF2309 domain-containing protein [Gammaproteobacteria bacterium]